MPQDDRVEMNEGRNVNINILKEVLFTLSHFAIEENVPFYCELYNATLILNYSLHFNECRSYGHSLKAIKAKAIVRKQ